MNDPYKLTLEQLLEAFHVLRYVESDLRAVAKSVGLPDGLQLADIASALRGMLAYLRGGKPEAYGEALDFELGIIAKRQVAE